jgi:N-acetylmuramoyl-L-alanine amidase
MKFSGTCSWFGGPDDMGVAPDEGLAFIFEIDDAPGLFLPIQPAGTTGLARRLDPDQFYVACRWDYNITSKEELLELRVVVRAPKTGREAIAQPADWGPHEEKTGGRAADLSPGLMSFLQIETDDQVEVLVPVPTEDGPMTVVISAGHGLHVAGASGPQPWGLNEVEWARKATAQIAAYLREGGTTVFEFYENQAHDQATNLQNIIAYHNSKPGDLNVSVHLNAYQPTETKPMGCEVLFLTQETTAREVSAAIAKAGELIDRGPKHRTNLAFLNQTIAPAILLELAFCDSKPDCELLQKNFEVICLAVAETIDGGGAQVAGGST